MIKFFEKNKIAAVYIPLVIYWMVLLTATSLPSQDLPKVGVSDKIEHFSAYLILAVLLNLTLLVQNKFETLRKYPSLSTLTIIAFYALIDELHQLFIPGRDCEALDWVADFIGAILGIILINIILNFTKAQLTKKS